MKNPFCLLLVFMLAFSGAIDAQTERPIRPHFRIMCIGDSITEGGKTFQVYRSLLYKKLEDASFTFEFVGTKSSATADGTILKHEGYGGKNIAFLANTVPPHFENNPADVLLIHAGHNNFAKDKPVPVILENTKKLIEDCRKSNPNVIVFLGQVITSKKLPKYSYIPDLNVALAKLASELNTAKSPVIIVDHADGFDPDTMTVADKVHPNAAGAEHMASKWADALKRRLEK